MCVKNDSKCIWKMIITKTKKHTAVCNRHTHTHIGQHLLHKSNRYSVGKYKKTIRRSDKVKSAMIVVVNVDDDYYWNDDEIKI